MIDFKSSICLVVGKSSSGTGFVVYQPSVEISYVVTCAHVVADQEPILVEGHPAQIVALGDKSKSLDLSVLEVHRLENKVPLVLSNGGTAGQKIQIPGIAKFDSILRPLNGFLGELINPWSDSGHCSVDLWDLNINEGEYAIQDGYSGSPVIDVETGEVIGVVSHRVGVKGKGIAIAIRSLEKIWEDMPSNLKYEKEKLIMNEKLDYLSVKQLTFRLKGLENKLIIKDIEIDTLNEKITDITHDLRKITPLTELASARKRQKDGYQIELISLTMEREELDDGIEMITLALNQRRLQAEFQTY
jgi:hypothetical protein